MVRRHKTMTVLPSSQRATSGCLESSATSPQSAPIPGARCGKLQPPDSPTWASVHRARPLKLRSSAAQRRHDVAVGFRPRDGSENEWKPRRGDRALSKANSVAASGPSLRDYQIAQPLNARRGFTLFELVAVLVVLAILAGAVAVSVRGHISNARLEAFLDRLETFDGRARGEARRRSELTVLSFDANTKLVSQISDQNSSGAARSFAVPGGLEIVAVKTVSDQASQGVLRIGVSPLGQTDTYALQLRASSGRELWLVVLGGSGQCLRFDKDNDVEDLFSLQLLAARNHAG